MTTSNLVILVVRYGLVVLFFPASALDKIFNFHGAMKQALQVFSSHRVAAALILAGVFVELVMGSVKNLGRYAASWIAWWPNRPSSTAALT